MYTVTTCVWYIFEYMSYAVVCTHVCAKGANRCHTVHQFVHILYPLIVYISMGVGRGGGSVEAC